MRDIRRTTGAALMAAAATLICGAAAAQQHLYCTDARGAGLFWDGQDSGRSGLDAAGRVGEVAPSHFTVNIVAEDRRLITAGDGGVREAACHRPEWPKGNRGIVSCVDASGAGFWVFHDDSRYTRSYLFGTPLDTDHTDPNIIVAHGTCRPY
ncbi:MAG: hypothetical protein VW644_11075 [Alphaproteobacteria bacterium]|jgi:hypothetical protein